MLRAADDTVGCMELTAGTTAIITVHLQHDIVAADGAFAQIFNAQVVERRVLDMVRRLVEGTRGQIAAVAHLRIAWAPDYSDMVANAPLLQMTVQAGALKEYSQGAELAPEVPVTDGDIVYTHRRMGGPAAELDLLLRASGVDTVVLCGVATNVSVEGWARTLCDLGYRVVVAEDATSAATLEAHEASIASLGLVGEIASTDDILAALTG